MKASRSPFTIVAAVLALVLLLPALTNAQSVRDRYEALDERDREVRARLAGLGSDAPAAVRDDVMREARGIVAGYEALVRRFHASGYADNALWNAATLSEALFARFSRSADQSAASHYRRRLIAEYPSSSLVREAKAATTARTSASLPEPAVAPAVGRPASVSLSTDRARLTSIARDVLPQGVRITLSLDREVNYREERLAGPDRVFFDLKDVQVAPELRDVVLRYGQDAVRQIRVGRHPDSTVRVVLDLEDVKRYSVFTLYNPFRVVVDCESASARPVVATGFGESAARANTQARAIPTVGRPVVPSPLPSSPAARAPSTSPPPLPAVSRVAAAALRAPVGSRPPPTPVTEEQLAPPLTDGPLSPPTATPPAPAAPHSNSAGGFSLSRQLGLGITRIVVDPGHGGHDPGALGKGLNEADLTLDVALRLEKLLHQEGLEVVLTRRTNVYVPLEERTALANRESADLFLSIHANASRNEAARGVETYFLSFASSPEAEAVAARENSSSSGEMHNLPDIIKAITLNNKLDESRDFAEMVQEALVSRLRRSNKDLRNLGVKKAPFVVLIGASMPSVLAEISFLTNKQEVQLLKTSAYKQRVAEALHASIMRYRRSLKGQGQIAEQ